MVALSPGQKKEKCTSTLLSGVEGHHQSKCLWGIQNNNIHEKKGKPLSVGKARVSLRLRSRRSINISQPGVRVVVCE